MIGLLLACQHQHNIIQLIRSTPIALRRTLQLPCQLGIHLHIIPDEKPQVAQPLKNLPSRYGIPTFVTVFIRTLSCAWIIQSQYYPIYLKSTFILRSHLPRSSLRSLSFWIYYHNPNACLLSLFVLHAQTIPSSSM
jgi:hypothetical protein